MAAALATLILNWKEDKAILWKFRRDKAPFAMAGRMYQILKLVTIFSFATLDFGSAAYWMLTGSEEDSGVRASLPPRPPQQSDQQQQVYCYHHQQAHLRHQHLFNDHQVSVLAHIFGFLTGLLAGFSICMDRIEERWEICSYLPK